MTGVGQILDRLCTLPRRGPLYSATGASPPELQALIYRTAHCLHSLGIAPGDRVAIISRNCPEVMM